MSAGDRPRVTPLAREVPEALVERVAERAAEIALARLAERGPEPWIGVEDAAKHLACSRKRVYDLVAQRRVRVFRDGRRLLFRRSWLDEALAEGPPPGEEVGRP